MEVDDEGRIQRDFGAEVSVALPEASGVADSVGLKEAVESLLPLEKKCRLGHDVDSLKRVVLHMVLMCREREDWAQLNATLLLISKRRSQSTKAIKVCVEKAMEYIEEAPEEDDVRTRLIETLREICEGKIYVEAHGARLTRMISRIREARGDIAGASDIMQDVHVETYGSMNKHDKADYILDQIRLTIAKRDFVRALITSRKINRKTIEDPAMQDIKVRFYQLMVQYNTHEKDSWELAQCYYKIFDTSNIRADQARSDDVLQRCVTFLLIGAYTNHKSDMMHRLLRLRDMERLPVVKKALELFTTQEIIPYPFEGQEALEAHDCLGEADDGSMSDELRQHWKQQLHTRIVEHNIRVISVYYTRIRTARLAELLGLDEDSVESHLSDMVSSAGIWCKIDRPAGIVAFRQPKTAETVLTDWTADITELLNLMEKTCHLVQRENMVHKL